MESTNAKRAIITLATERGNYYKGLARLGESLKVNAPDVEFIGFVGESSVGAPKHDSNKYAFKVYAFEKVREMGFTQILWLDCSVFAIRNVAPVFDVIEKDGYIMQEAGHFVGKWCNERTLDYFKVSREEAYKMLMYGNAGFLGLNFENDTAKQFFSMWQEAMRGGFFHGDHTDHRHDMTCGSIIANQLGMNKNYKSGNEWLQYGGIYSPVLNDSIIFKAQGL